jgi:hypothetical protein
MTYTSLEKLYVSQYEAPALARSFGRMSLQTVASLLVAQMFTILCSHLSLSVPPNLPSPHSRWYAAMWISAVLASGVVVDILTSQGTSNLLSVTPKPSRNRRLLPKLPQSLYFLRLLRGADLTDEGRRFEYESPAQTRFTLGGFPSTTTPSTTAAAAVSPPTPAQPLDRHRPSLPHPRLPHPRLPHPFVFLAVWVPLKIMQFMCVGKVLLAGGGFVADTPSLAVSPVASPPIAMKAMIAFLIQIALGDEWSRVLFVEQRVGLALIVSGFHLACVAR